VRNEKQNVFESATPKGLTMSPFGCLLYYTEAKYYSIKQCMSSIHEKREENLFVSTGSI
jgi:hypothetical protein